jgi:hypothetical protein
MGLPLWAVVFQTQYPSWLNLTIKGTEFFNLLGVYIKRPFIVISAKSNWRSAGAQIRIIAKA